MSLGFGLIKSIIEKDVPLTELTEQGLDETYFEGAERQAFEFTKNHKSKHGIYPNKETIEVESGSPRVFSDFPLEPVDYWIPQLRERKQFNILAQTNREITNKLDSGHTKDAIRLLAEAQTYLSQTQEGYAIQNLEDWQEEVLKSHDQIQTTPGITGIPFGFPTLDNITYGIQPGDLVTIVGVTGACKSYVCLRCALGAYLEGKNVILISPEMPEKQIARRLLALQSKLREQDIRKGRLSYFAVQKAKEIINQPIVIDNQEQDNYFKILPSGLYSDVQQIQTICSEYQPDLLVVDGFYLMNDSSSRASQHWQEAESILKILKQTGIQGNFGVLGSTQYNRSKPGKIEGARSTQSVEQLSSMFFSLEFEREEDRDMPKPQQTRLLKTKKTREGDSVTIRLSLDFDKMYIEEDDVVSGSNLLEMEAEADPSDEPFIEEM